MSDPPEQRGPLLEPAYSADAHRFAHDAMACRWGIHILGHERDYAEQAARAAFAEVDRLEQELSRYVETSDIARINALGAGERLRIGPDAFDCIELAQRLCEATNGAFDVTVGALLESSQRISEPSPAIRSASDQTPRAQNGNGNEDEDEDENPPRSEHNSRTPNLKSQISNQQIPNQQIPNQRISNQQVSNHRISNHRISNHQSSNQADPAPARGHHLHLDRRTHSVAVSVAGLVVDLGGIGKGYALDRAAETLREWSIDTALIHSGQSTLLALGSPRGAIGPSASGASSISSRRSGWEIAIRDPDDHARVLGTVRLRDRALSGSGTVIHGPHIIDPRTGKPAASPRGAWALAGSAAVSDALSTAFMVLLPDDVDNFCRGRADVGALLLLGSRRSRVLRRCGDAPELRGFPVS